MQCPYNEENNCNAFNNKCNAITMCSFKKIYTDCGFWNKKDKYIPGWQKVKSNEV